MLAVRREKFLDCIDQIMPLCIEVHNIVEKDVIPLPLDLDLELYDQSEKAGQFHCLVMRLHGQPIGFHWITYNPMPRFKGHWQAATDAIYVAPEHRKHSMFLIWHSEQYIKLLGASAWALATLDPEYRGQLWQRKGFKKSETVFIKRMSVCHQ